MLGAMRWREGFVEDVVRWNKVINERDVWPLHELRVILKLAGLIRNRKGRFAPTRAGRDANTNEHAGVLFAKLFHTTFCKFNLGFRDRWPEVSDFQATIAYPLAVLARDAEDCRRVRGETTYLLDTLTEVRRTRLFDLAISIDIDREPPA